jgi:O-antigen biosynthesis protein
MKHKKITIRLRNAGRLLRKEGPIAVSIRTLQKIEDKRISNKQARKHEINVYAKYNHILLANPEKPFPTWGGTNRDKLRFNWLMPPPGKGSGGHLNIFRFIKFLEEAGHENRIYLYTRGEHGSVEDVNEVMGGSYPVMKARMEWLDEGDKMKDADGVFATSWETVYAIIDANINARHFYFVQDFEPFFYPMGSHYILAENTYRFGFYGVTAGGWLGLMVRFTATRMTSPVKKSYSMFVRLRNAGVLRLE